MLIIENKTGAEAVVTFVFKEGEKDYRFEEFVTSDSLVLELGTTEENASKEYYFGIGTWKVQNSLDDFASMIERIDIETRRSKETFEGKEQVKAFLERHLAGRQKQVIAIELQ